ncbi:penicillin acylase family protein [Flagellimonas sp. DF-77]|uniref:penicillin acylase family protein n=1 Tax=Flagellimonas algarum TaxID=3230298 RepID=UPI003394EF92
MLLRSLFLFTTLACLLSCSKNETTTTLVAEGLQKPVEVVRDPWGINHIYAANQHDLFFAQGYTAAADRLFQFEIWRRQATGTVAEMLGERELQRDIGTRLFRFRGDMETEMAYYHEDGVEIITAYTEGVNAYIESVLETPDVLPIEFKILDILPQKWTPEVVISRHQGLLGNIGLELEVGRAVAELGAKKVKELYWFHPQEPDLTLDPSIAPEQLSDTILALYRAYRKPVRFTNEDVVATYRNPVKQEVAELQPDLMDERYGLGSNNWVIQGHKMANGHSVMANDPHRTIAVPSLRYMSHLVAPGWNVIGGGEPEIPGISIGHNEYGAWGLTVYRTDGEDLYVYELNPENPKQYRFQGEWVDMTEIEETIKVKGQNDRQVTLRYTHHGPVTHVDTENHLAYAVRCAWLEPGGSPYLASLRMDQAQTWDEFREACNYSHIPGENMIWAGTDGTIGWQAVGIAPIRKNFSGLVPVPGDGRYEWDSYLPIIEKPHASNPERGFLATANQNVTPPDYDHWDAVGYSWSDPYRGQRVNEVLGADKALTMADMKALQTDYLSVPARLLTPFLEGLEFTGTAAEAKEQLNDWDLRLEARSIAAAIYVAWENEIRALANERFIPKAGQGIIAGIQLGRILQWIETPDARFGEQPILGRNAFLSEAFVRAVTRLETQLGADIGQWQYGQEKNKHAYFEHALSDAVNEVTRRQLDIGPVARGGNAYTPNSTGNNLRQSSGASFRIIADTGDWDASVGANGPGQSGDPDSPFYDNLFESWAANRYFPIYYSRSKIDSVAVTRTKLLPTDK